MLLPLLPTVPLPEHQLFTAQLAKYALGQIYSQLLRRSLPGLLGPLWVCFPLPDPKVLNACSSLWLILLPPWTGTMRLISLWYDRTWLNAWSTGSLQ